MIPDPRLPDAGALAAVLQPILHVELATIRTLASIAPHEDEPGCVLLYHSAKTTKQASVEQMLTLLRMAGAEPSERSGVLGRVLELQTRLVQRVSTTATLKALRVVEEDVVARYRDAHASLDGFARQALTRPYHRAVQRWVTLVAHVARRENGDASLAEKLPLPLSAYFASGRDRADSVCVRCLFDRPGALPPIARDAPRPTQYLCGACHDEVLSRFPPDLLVQADRWPAPLREDRVIERALGRPEKLRAEREVHAVLSGLPPDVPEPVPARAEDVPGPGRHRRADQPPSALDVARGGASEAELAYTDLLFDFRSVRANW